MGSEIKTNFENKLYYLVEEEIKLIDEKIKKVIMKMKKNNNVKKISYEYEYNNGIKIYLYDKTGKNQGNKITELSLSDIVDTISNNEIEYYNFINDKEEIIEFENIQLKETLSDLLNTIYRIEEILKVDDIKYIFNKLMNKNLANNKISPS